ncbi:hypothetical protein QOZ80_8AG0633270 [Eleusine coracana subsp. coracana]|nr:hypothetical protein QOZ80_8AG0633270 [Eleusine coracana subsp. coracana]
MAMSARPLLAALLFPALLLSAASAADSKNNPADQLVSLINSNRTASKASSLADNQGLGCISLQYIKAFQGQCNQSNYASPDEVFNILIDDAKSLQVLHSKNHTEVGAAVSGTDGGGPYFWCVLFSDGKPSTSFKVEGGEVPKTAMHPGCFSGNNDDCMGPKNGAVSSSMSMSRLVCVILFAVACVFAL